MAVQLKVLTVSQMNYYLKSLMEGDANLSSVYISGEISNFTNHYKSGHFYFSLKDAKSALKCVMFASYAGRVRFVPKDGMKVLVHGRISVYEASGQYQLYVNDMQPEGVGALSLAFEQLKEKLAAEGLFDVARKKKLPAYPLRVGVITSPTGAAIRDIEQILARRFPLAEVVVCPVLVQGDGAAEQLAGAVERFNAARAADVLIIGRGGGSAEDLWAFNDEKLARTVAASAIPVVSAVGHETDYTICDFAADLRAPTPSAAAELVVPDVDQVRSLIRSFTLGMRSRMEFKQKACERELSRLIQHRVLQSQLEQIEQRRQRLDWYTERMKNIFSDRFSRESRRFAELSGKLHSLSPMQVLARGYAIAFDQTGKVIKSIKKVTAGQNLSVTWHDGTAHCVVTGRQEENAQDEKSDF